MAFLRKPISESIHLVNVVNVEGDYTAQVTDEFIGVDTTTLEITITLPIMNGVKLTVKDIAGNATANNITISTEATIDGNASVAIGDDYASLSLYCDDDKWWIY